MHTISWTNGWNFNKLAPDTLFGHGKELIRFLWPWPHFQGHYIIKTPKMSLVKSLCAHYLFNQWLKFDQTSTDTSSRWRKEVIRFLWPWPYFQGHYIVKTPKMSLVKSLCAHYLFNQWLKFDQTSTDTSSRWRKEVIRFLWPWPYFQGHYIVKTLKMTLVCTLSHESLDGICSS